jgi:hypothetical protein
MCDDVYILTRGPPRAGAVAGSAAFTALGFSNDEEDEIEAREFIREREMHWAQVVGQGARQLIRRHWRAIALPTVFCSIETGA